tara:strand:- start:11852 stop:12913 length:1062 start_codon:yes stop_codon:yes gene_type:complete
MKKVIVITGVTGQDGSHMVDYLLDNTDHEIYGAIRRLSVKNHQNISHRANDSRFHLIDLDLTDGHSIDRRIREIKPDYFINFAAQSFVGVSWDTPRQTFETNALGVIDILESIREHVPECRFYNAGSSEEFGDVLYSPQDEDHPLRPRSPYGASKAAARHIVKVYRESYDLYAVQGWLFNHEGTRRGEEFVTRKISMGMARIAHAIESQEAFDPISLGNLEAQRDWSDAEDFIRSVWLMLNQENPKDYVIGSTEAHSIREFVELCAKEAGLEGSWVGEGLEEEYVLANYLLEEHNLKSAVLVNINKEFYRPAEVSFLQGDCTLAEKELGWERQTDFPGLVKKMYQHDYKLLSH